MGDFARVHIQSASLPATKARALVAISAGGLIAGTLDLTQALFLFGRRVPLVIAAGLLGPNALHGGVAIYVAGILLHFFIAFSAAAIYYGASRRLHFMTEDALYAGSSMAWPWNW